MFERLDQDGDHTITLAEIDRLTEEDKSMLYTNLSITDPREIFGALDVDDSGCIDIDEFCDGIWQVAISKAPIELKRLEKQVNSLKHQMQENTGIQRTMQETLETVLSTVNAQGNALRSLGVREAHSSAGSEPRKEEKFDQEAQSKSMKLVRRRSDKEEDVSGEYSVEL